MQNVNAEIVSIGTEILLAEITDTNSVYLARKLRDIGVNLFYMTSVGDNERRISDVIRAGLSRSDVVITTGGLGPTVDDVTRQAVAAATDRPLEFHQSLLDTIAERFTQFRVPMTENNRQQAFLPEQATVIHNAVGTAPAFIVEYKEKIVISLPGVPREMEFLIEEQVIPFLRQRFGLENDIILTRILRTAGIGESALDTLLGSELLSQNNPTVGLAAHVGQTDIRLTAKASSEIDADRMLSEIEAEVRKRVGEYIFGIDEIIFEDAFIDLVRADKATLAVCEAGNQATFANRLAQTGSGSKFLISTSHFDTVQELQTASWHKPDNSSLLVFAEWLAFNTAQNTDATIGVAILFQSDKDDAHNGLGNGTAIAVYSSDKTLSRLYQFDGNTNAGTEWTSMWAMAMIWRLLKNIS